MYQPLGKTPAFDYRSTFSFSSAGKGSKPQSSETKYSAVNLDLTPGTQYINPSRTWITVVFTGLIKFSAYLCFILTFPISAFFCLKLVHQYERLVVFRIGHLLPVKGPGLVLILPCIDRWSKVDLRTKAFNVPPTRICTTDGGLMLFGSVVHYRVQNPLRVKSSLQDMNHSIRVTCQAAMSKILAKKRFSDVKVNYSRYNFDIQIEINDAAAEWGLEIGRVELSQPTVEVAPPNNGQSGFLSKLTSGMSGGPSGGSDSMAQVMNMMAMGGGFTNPATLSSSSSVTSDPVLSPLVGIDSAAKNLMSIVKCVLNEELVSKVGASYEINLTDNDMYYYIDLKYASGSCGDGHLPQGQPDATLTMDFQTLQEIMSGKLSAFSAYTGGQLDIQGDVKCAMRLEELGRSIQG